MHAHTGAPISNLFKVLLLEKIVSRDLRVSFKMFLIWTEIDTVAQHVKHYAMLRKNV